jgi:hypothetical protein
MERLSPDHRIGRGPTQPPLMEFALKKNNPPEACNSRGRLFLRATLPGARREWFSERDGGTFRGDASLLHLYERKLGAPPITECAKVKKFLELERYQ